MKFLLHNSHHQDGRPNGWSGAPGEADWVMDLNGRIATLLTAKGAIVVRVDGDLQDHPEFHQDYDAFIAPHYEADVHNSGGCFWGRAGASLTAQADDKLGQTFWRRFRAIEGVPPERFNWNNVNVTDYYGFRLTSAKTPGILVEHGVGWGANKAWLREKIGDIVNAWVDSLVEFAGGIVIPNLPGTSTDPTMAVLGPTSLATGPETEWLSLYRTLAPQAGIRGEIAYAQALHETGNFTFGGTAKPEWNNPAGIGVTGAPDVGNRFATKEEGVRAHLGHLLWYFGPTHPVNGFCDKDQRHFGAHKGLPNDIRQLNGKWAVPGTGYGESIVSRAATLGGDIVTDAEWLEKYNRLLAPGLEAEINQKKAEATADAVKQIQAKINS